MARPLRIELEDALYHVMARGDARADIFLDDEDRQAFILSLADLVLVLDERSLPFAVRDAGTDGVEGDARSQRGLYTGIQSAPRLCWARASGALQSAVGRQGQLPAGAVTLCGSNPVRAGLVASAGDWHWSSYLTVMGKASIPVWLAVDDTLAIFRTFRGPARRAFAQFVADGVDALDPTEDCARGGFVGGEPFVERMLERVDAGILSREITRKNRLRRLSRTVVAVTMRSGRRMQPSRTA